MVFLKEFFQKVEFEKKSADDKKACTISQQALGNGFLYLSLTVGWFLQEAAGEADPGGHSVLVLEADNPQDYQQFCGPLSIFLSLK